MKRFAIGGAFVLVLLVALAIGNLIAFGFLSVCGLHATSTTALIRFALLCNALYLAIDLVTLLVCDSLIRRGKLDGDSLWMPFCVEGLALIIVIVGVGFAAENVALPIVPAVILICGIVFVEYLMFKRLGNPIQILEEVDAELDLAQVEQSMFGKGENGEKPAKGDTGSGDNDSADNVESNDDKSDKDDDSPSDESDKHA